MSSNGTRHDSVFVLCRKLLLIDNRPDSMLADATGLDYKTIRRIRDGDECVFIRSTTVAAIARASNKVVVFSNKR